MVCFFGLSVEFFNAIISTKMYPTAYNTQDCSTVAFPFSVFSSSVFQMLFAVNDVFCLTHFLLIAFNSSVGDQSPPPHVYKFEHTHKNY